MQQGNFNFLDGDYQRFYEQVRKAETYLQTDAEACAIFCRKALEEMVAWMFDTDRKLESVLPDDDNTLNALMHKPGFIGLVGNALFTDVNVIRKTGNLAVHVSNKKKVTTKDAYTCVVNLHAFAQWLVSNYSGVIQKTPFSASKINETLIPEVEDLATIPLVAETITSTPEGIQYHTPSEKLTRELYIDILLKEAGWDITAGNMQFEYHLKHSRSGADKADYVLFGDDGTALAVVEAKKATVDGRDAGLDQGKRYADALEKEFGKRPVIFTSNGFEHHIWDDLRYPYRQIYGFYSKEDLETLFNRRMLLKPLTEQAVNVGIAGRHYQIEAIQRAKEELTLSRRDLLFIMATGSGKTRTVAALVDVLSKANWVKRILFLADRNALISQAKNNFNDYLPQLTSVNLVKDKDYEQARIVFSTYQTMINHIDEDFAGDRRVLTTGYFDLIIFDEVHRSIYQKYGAIFNYFDGIRFGLTATPKAETHRDTYELFKLETGVPTFNYELRTAVDEGFLVAPVAMKVPLKFPREGIKYAELSKEDKDKYEETFATNSDLMPDEISASALNEWLFNEHTVNTVLQLLMDNGLKVNNGDTIGKSIIFAKNQSHARFIEQCFNKMYPMLKGHFLKVITCASDRPEDAIDLFKDSGKLPQIVVSVDMLDTGIDVPEILNLVFFKPVKSSSKYWQMVGRGTRLCEGVFGPSQHKKHFYIFDYCGNIEFFGDNPDGIEPNMTYSLSQRVFMLKLNLTVTLEKLVADDELNEFRLEMLEELQKEILLFDRDSFVNRPHLRLIEVCSDRSYWNSLTEDKVREVIKNIVPLLINSDTDFDARRFDLIAYQLMDALLKEDKSVGKYINTIKFTAGQLLKQTSIPQVAAKKEFLQALINDAYWENVTVYKVEELREEIRALIKFIDKDRQSNFFTNFKDELTGEIEHVDIIGTGVGFETYNQRVRSFIRKHDNYIVINKIKNNQPISAEELGQVRELLFSEDPEASSHLDEVLNGQDFMIFIRSIVGLENKAAKALFAEFINRSGITAEQIRFIDTMVDYITQNGSIDKPVLFDRPFTDINQNGIIGVFEEEDAVKLIKIIDGFSRVSNFA